METSPNLLLPLKGEVCAQYIRCGKAGCHCRQGQPHGPYYYRIWREGRRVNKVYVKQADLESVREACAAYKRLAARLREQRTAREEVTRRIKRAWRTTQSLRLTSRRFGTGPGGE